MAPNLATRWLCVCVTTVTLAIIASPNVARATTQSSARARANALHKAATKRYKAGKYKKASELYHRAFKMSSVPSYLFNAARAEQRAFAYDAAERDFRRYLRLSNQDARGQSRARVHLKEIREIRAKLAEAKRRERAHARAEARPTSRSHTTAAPNVNVKPAGWRRPAGWALVGVGSLAVGFGVYSIGSTSSDAQALDAALAKKDADGIVGVDYQSAESQRQSINDRLVRGYMGLGIGAVAAGVGAWMLISRPEASTVSVLPGRDRLSVSWVTRF